MKDELYLPHIVVSPDGVYWLGHAKDRRHAWEIALGWPDDEEIYEKYKAGWYCTDCTVTWKDPRKSRIL